MKYFLVQIQPPSTTALLTKIHFKCYESWNRLTKQFPCAVTCVLNVPSCDAVWMSLSYLSKPTVTETRTVFRNNQEGSLRQPGKCNKSVTPFCTSSGEDCLFQERVRKTRKISTIFAMLWHVCGFHQGTHSGYLGHLVFIFRGQNEIISWKVLLKFSFNSSCFST